MKQLEIDKDQVLQAMQGFNEEDSERASDVGESRQRIGEFLEHTGINNKAFAHCRMILRTKKDDKRQDWLRSMRALMPLMEEQIAAIGTRDAFDVPAAAAAQAQAPEEDDDGLDPDDLPEGDDEADDDEGDAEIAAEAEEFAAAVDEALGAAPVGNVKAFKSRKASGRAAAH